MARDELTQRRHENESTAWDEVIESAADMLHICPVCDVIDYIAACESCGQRMCAACFGVHEQHPCGNERSGGDGA